MKYTELEFFPGDTVKVTEKNPVNHVKNMDKYIGTEGKVLSIAAFRDGTLILVNHGTENFIWDSGVVELVEAVEREVGDDLIVANMEGFLEHVTRLAETMAKEALSIMISTGELMEGKKDEPVLH